MAVVVFFCALMAAAAVPSPVKPVIMIEPGTFTEVVASVNGKPDAWVEPLGELAEFSSINP